MSQPATLDAIGDRSPGDSHPRLRHVLEHIAHLLPSQAPIQVFVHHNTLHALEELPFHQAVQQGSRIYGCHPYLPEERYRELLTGGRILPEDLAAVLLDDLTDDGDVLIGFLATRYHLRLAMLQHPLRMGTDAELRWLIAEADAVRLFLDETPLATREQMVKETRRWIMRDLANGQNDPHIRHATAALMQRFGHSHIEQWSDATWQAFTLHLLWYICRDGVHGVPRFQERTPLPIRHRDLLLRATGIDTDRSVNEVMIRYSAAFLDQGLAGWMLPHRERGYLAAFCALYQNSRPVPGWLRELPRELQRIADARLDALQVIEESLAQLGVERDEQEEYLVQTALALRGWAGMCWQMETNAEWTVRPAPADTLAGYLAVRLLLERLAIAHVAREALEWNDDLRGLRARLRKGLPHAERVSVEQRAFLVFQLAQHIGWKPADLHQLSKREWSLLVEEIESFNSVERRRVYQLAFERRYRNQMLDAISSHARRSQHRVGGLPRFQLICCLDEREESFRRHVEEVAPDSETFGTAGFFGVAMYYRGLADAHYVPLCPIVVKPRHYVKEEVGFSLEQSHRRRSETRRALGRASHQVHLGSRSALVGVVTSLLGSLASIPLVARVLFPRATARVRQLFRRFVEPPPVTRLLIERAAPEPGPAEEQHGYSLDEMAAIGLRVLQEIGLTHAFAPLVIVAGHGSSSINNPHASAYDCGACGGGRGGPNARALAMMLDDPRVRERLAAMGLVIPAETVFVGAFHNTCDDSITYFDLDRLPSSHRAAFAAAQRDLNTARQRNARERCRRFESAPLSLSDEMALRHVEARSEDLSQVRPEYGHSTNAMCIVGRRTRTRGLYLDRRAFLTSYDPTQDDAQHSVLTRILQAVVPVCSGINLEYYFSSVDPAGYGCGTKLPHNITSLLGVMDGAASDLRTGLNWQMVEIHEPVRLLIVVESTPQALLDIMERNPAIARIVRNEWVQLAVLSPDSAALQLFCGGRFEPYRPENETLPTVTTSVDWYRGWREHLSCAIVESNGAATKSHRQEVAR